MRDVREKVQAGIVVVLSVVAMALLVAIGLRESATVHASYSSPIDPQHTSDTSDTSESGDEDTGFRTARGVNVRHLENVEAGLVPATFEWVKLYERFDTMPVEPLPYQVLYRIDVNRGDRWHFEDHRLRPDLDAIRVDVRNIAAQGLGVVDAYEIGNEPNVDWQWESQAPDPADYVAVLRVAYEEIKAVDPSAIVVSGGLAPVGRVGGPYGVKKECTANSGVTYRGNDCRAMDERLYAQAMFEAGGGSYFDVFGYHPYGFAYEPERALGDLPLHDNGNGFAFRGAEAIREVMVEQGWAYKPMWATEFGWLRDPATDGFEQCHKDPGFAGVEWYVVSEEAQADYLVRAFRYADAHWPWMGAMFVWDLDFQMQGVPCQPGRYYAIRKYDGSIPGAPTQAYVALSGMAGME